MNKWSKIAIIALVVALLAGCGKQAAEPVVTTEATTQEMPVETTMETESVATEPQETEPNRDPEPTKDGEESAAATQPQETEPKETEPKETEPAQTTPPTTEEDVPEAGDDALEGDLSLEDSLFD